MAITDEQNTELTDMLSDLKTLLNGDHDLGDWAEGFVRDMIERHDKYGTDTRMSEKQWAKLREIHDENVGTRDEPETQELDDEIPF